MFLALALVPMAFTAKSARLTGPVTYWSGNGHYYDLVRDPIDWDHARIAAANRVFNGSHGHLVTFSSQAENDFVASLGSVRSPMWIGGIQAPGSVEPAVGRCAF